MSTFNLCLQQPKDKIIGRGVLSIGRDGKAMFFLGEGEKVEDFAAEMDRAKIEFAGASGIMLSGMEPVGFDRHGSQKYRFQEWWLTYITEEK